MGRNNRLNPYNVRAVLSDYPRSVSPHFFCNARARGSYEHCRRAQAPLQFIHSFSNAPLVEEGNPGLSSFSPQTFGGPLTCSCHPPLLPSSPPPTAWTSYRYL
ncbi:hypothetical protein GQ43DRAFT_76940 [Delitschia confertaspora ATCC 74209]|uniref:Uncharacterized protein n=1 Tax=Delitschia confertaspora ATCC 74209 TaxID=1513339 RepID=A0A9P4MP98_9PLEO|nr:hypothetical protein GQ43DRAFT_76940 [Delitschia confertaspora ATCC 74209]